VDRAVLEREIRVVEVRGERVRVKLGRLAGEVSTTMPEHADLERLAERTGVAIRQLWHEAMSAAEAEAVEPEPEPTEPVRP
jgi:uncharacterized protein (DUF111 family)